MTFGTLIALAGIGSPASAEDGTVEASAAQRGYVLVDNAGVTTGFGDAAAAGSLSGTKLRAPIVDAESTPTGLGHVMAASDGGVFTFGDAPFLGSLAGTKLNAPIVGVDVTRTGEGYILFAADGGVFTFGDAPYRGSLGSMKLNKPIVDGALNKANDGYILTAGDGGVFTFGNTSFGGSMAGTKLNGPVVEIMMADEGPGYALIADDGGIFTFNGFTFYGSLGGMKLNAPITDAAPSSTGDGYNLLGADGGVFAFGDAPFAGSLGGTKVPRPLIAILGLANEAPVANADTYSATEDTPLAKSAAEGVLANDTDDDGDPLTASLVTGPTKGTLTLNGDGSFTYTPNANANGTDTFTYRATDSNDASDTAKATINVGGVNDAPVAVGDTGATSEDTALVVAAPGVLANDADIDLDPLTAVLVDDVDNGSLTLNPNGSYTYTPNANFNGADSFTYKANDGAADSNTVTVALTVTAVNDAPVAVNDVGSTDEDTALNVPAPGVLANDSDVEGSPMTAGLVDDVDNGTLTLNPNGSYTYTPNADYNGVDSFTYKANDGTAEGNTATVTLTVTAVNDAPVADDDTYSTDEDVPLNLVAPGVLVGDVDVDGDSLSTTVLDDVDHGTLTLNPNGSFTYSPAANYNGPDAFTYTVADGNGGTDIGAVTLTVNAVNDAPVAVDDAHNTPEDTPLTVAAPGVLSNDTDVEGSSLSAVLVAGPSNGTLTLAADGGFTYTPNADFAGGDSFTYKANDGAADSNTATVTLTVGAVNDAPVAADNAYNTDEDLPLNVVAPGVLANDTDADGNPLTAVLVAGPSNGTLTLNANGSFSYSPNANYHGADSFTYKANDGSTDSNTATVTLTVASVNDAPVAVDDAYATNEDTPLVVAAAGVLANDTDVEGPLSATNFGDAVNGTVVGNPDGSFTFTPAANFSGTATFGYTVSDGTLTDAGTVTVTVNPVADAPVATNDSYSTDEDLTLNVVAPAVLANDTDADGNALTAVLVNGPANGTLTLNANGSFSYTPNPNFNGADTFTYKANDGGLDSNIATVTITVNPIADAPVAVDDGPYTSVQNTNLTVAAPGVLANDTDADGQALTAGNASDPAHGTVTLNPNGSFTYAPDTFFTGTDTFTYDVSDGTTTDSGTVTINVTPPNDTPTADATSASGNEDGGAITVNLTGHDGDGDSLTFTAGTATNGLVTVPSGTSCDANTPSTCTATVTYTPNANFNGGDSFTYTVNDGTIDSAPATATITVNPVNDEPTFTKGSNQAVNEDAGAQTVNGWATAVSAGPANESAQAVTFTVTTDNDGMFSALPAVNSAGDLTYTANANVNGSVTVSVTPVDDGGTANGGDDTGATQTFTITVAAVNDAPSFTKGSDQTVNEDAGAQSVSNWASAISKGPGDESAQSLSFTTSNDNNALFSVQPGVTPLGTLVYTAAPNAVGSATVTITLSDDGGTAGGGVDTSPSQTFTITVNPVNDAPSFTKGSNDTVAEDSGARTVSGWSTNHSAGPADEAAQTVTVERVSTSNDALFAVLPAVDSGGTLTYTPAANAFGVATVTMRAKDDGGTANGGSDTGSNQAFDITVTSVNDVPDAVDDADSTNEDTAKVVNVLGNDTDVDTTDTLTVDSVTQPSNGSVTIAGDKSNVTFDPGAAFHDLDTGDTEVTTFTYTVSDGNGGTDTATVTVTVTGVNDAPAAVDQNHTAFGNTSLAVGGASATGPRTTASGGALTGVTDPDDNVFTVSTSGTSAQGGTVTMNADGTFAYLPASGYNGADSFDFTVSDSEATDTETVNVTVSGMAWYVDNSLGSVGDGRSSSPYNSLAPLNNDGTDLDEANEKIFVYPGSGPYGTLSLESGQKLHGHPLGLSTGSETLVAENVGGTRPTINAVALGANSDVQGLVLGGNASGPALTGTNPGTATVGTDPDHNVTVNNPGNGGMTLSGGTPTIELDSLTSGGGTNGISLTNVGGSVVVGGGAISGASGSDIFVSGGNASTISYAGTVTNTAGRSVEILNRTAGTVTLSGAVTDTGTGIALTNNDNSTVRFTSGAVSSTVTGANHAFTATDGGTVEVTGANNTLSAAGGFGLQIENTAISSNGVTLKSLAATGGTNGIKLNATGTSGGLTVTGTGTAHSGGTISGTTGQGISLASTSNVSLTRMRVQNAGDDGIGGTSVTGFTFANGTVQSNGNAAGEGGMDFTNLHGTTSISSSTVTGSYDHNVDVVNDAGNATIGFSNATITSSVTNSGINVETSSTGAGRAVATVNVTGTNTVSDNFADGLQCSGTALSGATGSDLTCNVTGATFHSNNIAMDITQAQNADVQFNVANNNLTDHDSHALNVFTNSPLVSGASLTGKVMNNAIGTAGVKDSGSELGSGIRVVVQGRADSAVRIEGNTIRETPNWYGIEVYGRSGDGGADFTVVNNTVVAPTGTNSASCTGTAGVMCPADAFHIEANSGNVVCAKVSGNTSYNPNIGSGGGSAYYLKRGTTAAPAGGGTATTFRLEGTGASPSAEIAATNTGTPVTVDAAVTLTAPGTCTTVP